MIRSRGGDLAPETENFKEKEPNSAWAFAQLCRLGLGLVPVSHANLVGLIRIPRPFSHPSNATGERTLLHHLRIFARWLRPPDSCAACRILGERISWSSPPGTTHDLSTRRVLRPYRRTDDALIITWICGQRRSFSSLAARGRVSADSRRRRGLEAVVNGGTPMRRTSKDQTT